MQPSHTARWKEIECEMTNGAPVQAIVGEKGLMQYLEEGEHQWISLALKIWHNIIRSNNMKEIGKVSRWCAFDHELITDRWNNRFRVWNKSELAAYCTFIHHGKVKSFQELKDLHGLTNQDFHRSLQVRHLVEEIIRKDKEEKMKTGILKVFSGAYSSEPNNKIIARLYAGLQSLRDDITICLKEKWGKEGNFQLSEEEWEKLIHSQWETTCSSTWREFGWKNITRFFISPEQKKLKEMGSGCWRQCGEENANHYHIFWGCPPIAPFWQGVHKCMKDILKMDIPFKFEILYSGKIEWEFSATKGKYLFNIMMVAVKKCIARKWLKTEVPMIDEWMEIMYEILVMERMTFTLRLQQEKLIKYWGSWIDYRKPLRPYLT